MNRLRTYLLLAATLAVTLVLSAAPALATEGGGAGAGEEGSSKLELPKTAHDRVGLILIILAIPAVLLMLDNMRRQLRGERKQASGEFRWR